MVPTAQLKVFAPLGSFPPRERERWARYVADGGGLSRDEVQAAEERTAARLLTGGAPEPDEAALVRRAGTRVLLCPLQLQLRATHAFATFRRGVPPGLVDQFVPSGSAMDHQPPLGSAPHILDAPWAVPLHWFVAFAPDDRHLTDPPEGRGAQVRYLTTVAQAVWRLERAIEIVEETIADGEEILIELAELASWLTGFSDDAVVELDLTRVGASMPPEQLREDRTCADLHDALDALDAGDAIGAAALYAACRARWSHQRARQHAS